MEIKKIKIEEEKIEEIRFKVKCPFCKKQIQGNSKNAILYNIKKHIDFKHNKTEVEDDKPDKS